MRIQTVNKRKEKSEVVLPNLFLIFFILIIVIFVSSIAGALILDQTKITSLIDRGKRFFTSIVSNEIQNETYLQQENGLNTLTLDIPFESYQQILDKRNDALARGILISSDTDMVKAEATLNQQEPIKIELRLKGDWIDHLESNKWSYRIHTRGDGQILGMTNFSIQAPETRNYLAEWGYHQNLLLEDILTTRYGFINVIENGKSLGVYAIEDSFTTELLESQQEREGIILRFDEDALWINRANFTESSYEMLTEAQDMGLYAIINNEQAELKVFREVSIASNSTLSIEAETAINLLQGFIDGKLSASEVFDVEKFGRFLAITDLWGGNHASFWHNLRYYYNPITSLIEPIGFDGNSLEYSDKMASIFLDETYFDHVEIRRAYATALERITQEDYLVWLKTNLENDLGKYLAPLQEEYGADVVTEPWNQLEERRLMLHKQIHPPFPVLGNYQIIQAGTSAQLEIALQNLMILPVQFKSIEIQVGDNQFSINSSEFSISGDVLSDMDFPEIPYVYQMNGDPTPILKAKISLSEEITGAIAGTDSMVITAEVQISGVTQEYQIPLGLIDKQVSISARPTALFANAESDLLRHPFVKILDEQTVVIEAGDWSVDGDLVIPEKYELVILPGTTLRFDDQAIFLLGNKIFAKGTENAPIIFTSKKANWGGMVVLSAPGQSKMENIIIENTSVINREGWILTGGVTFYESPVEIASAQFRNHAGEDALNLIHSDYTMQFTKFDNSFADALDTDFSDGVISNCSFSNIGGDAVDISGSQLTIEDSKIMLITDKGVSVGENSVVILNNISIDTANIGVASKDLSSVTINGITMKDIAYAGFAAYIKKPVYGPASINATGVSTDAVDTLSLVQNGNQVIIDGTIMPTVELDVDTLYKLGILGN
jgi:hypothetical protein